MATLSQVSNNIFQVASSSEILKGKFSRNATITNIFNETVRSQIADFFEGHTYTEKTELLDNIQHYLCDQNLINEEDLQTSQVAIVIFNLLHIS